MKKENKLLLAMGAISIFALSGCNVDAAYDEWKEEKDAAIQAQTQVLDINYAPVIQPGTLLTQALTNSSYIYTPIANDVNGDTLAFSILNKPDWASFNEATGTMSGKTFDYEGIYENIIISVTDGEKVATLEPFSITVSGGNHPPEISGTPTTQISTDEEYYFKPSVKDVDGDTLTYTIINKPNWISFDSQSGTMRGTAPDFVTVYSNISIVVSDGLDTARTPIFSIAIEDRNHEPIIEGIPTKNIPGGEFYSFEPIANDIDGDELTFHIASKPTWASFDTKTGALTGIVPTKLTTYSDINIYVYDGIEAAYLPSFDITVTETEIVTEGTEETVSESNITE